MKNVSRDYSHKEFVVIFINPRTGWSDFSESDNPMARIAKFKAEYDLGHTRTAGMGDAKDVLVHIVKRTEFLKPLA